MDFDFQTIITSIGKYLDQKWPAVLGAVIILIVGRWLAKFVSKLIGEALIRAKLDPTLTNFIKHLCRIAILVFVVIAAMGVLGIDTASFAVVIGAAGLAIGLALQGSLSNFAAGVLLVIFKPFKVGDFVELAGKMGTVKEIQIFNTIINSPDNVRIIIPNGQVTGTNIMNFTVNGTRRIDLVIGVSYEDDLKKTHDVIEKIITGDDRVLKEPAYTIAVSELADSSVNFVVRPWVNAVDYWAVRFDLIEKIKLALDKNGITIPFPQRDVHMKNEAS